MFLDMFVHDMFVSVRLQRPAVLDQSRRDLSIPSSTVRKGVLREGTTLRERGASDREA